jgi:hypothetical protein
LNSDKHKLAKLWTNKANGEHREGQRENALEPLTTSPEQPGICREYAGNNREQPGTTGNNREWPGMAGNMPGTTGNNRE